MALKPSNFCQKTLVKSEKVRRSLPLTPAWNGVVAAYQKSVLITHLQVFALELLSLVLCVKIILLDEATSNFH